MVQIDLHQARYRPATLSLCHGKTYTKLRKEYPALKKLTDSEITRIIHTFNKNLWQTAIDNRQGVDLPQRLGHIFIGTCEKKKAPNIDYNTSKELQKRIQHRNWESDNYLAKIFYTTFAYKYNFHNHELWAFNPGRNFKRTLGKEYPKQWKQYIEVPRNMKLNRLFQLMENRPTPYTPLAISLETYNEFEF